MTRRNANHAASIHARLLAGAQQRQEDFNLTLQRYAAERFLYRLGASRFRNQLILKGAMLYALWGGPIYRATRDLDLTGYAEHDPQALSQMIQEICRMSFPEDGLSFDPLSVTTEPIRDQSEYRGFRVKLDVRLGTARIAMQIDVGFGDAIEPPADEVEYPTLVELPAPKIRAYPQEAVIAEKVHAMVVIGERNSRFKDFYDVYALASQFSFDGPRLARAISATFERRRTPFANAQPAALTPRFFADPERAANWRRYLARSNVPGVPVDFNLVGERLRTFISPVLEAVSQSAAFPRTWAAGGPWANRRTATESNGRHA